MDKILVKGTQNFLGKEIPVITGGFSEGQKMFNRQNYCRNTQYAT